MPDPSSYAITFACYNQVDYTRQCIESMQRSQTPLDRLVVVDNASSDQTREYLSGLALGRVIHNRCNLGCGVAWNQGALELQADWTIVMNNDVIVSDGWVNNLIEAGTRNNLDIVSPAMIEGKLDYDFEDLARRASRSMKDALRPDWPHAVCLAIHKRVWQDVGYFRATPKLLGYEDTLFFHEARLAGMRMATTGASWIHHFGSITQSAMKRERGLREKDDLGQRYNHRLLQQSWLNRKLDKLRTKRRLSQWRKDEMATYGMTLWGNSSNGKLIWN